MKKNLSSALAIGTSLVGVAAAPQRTASAAIFWIKVPVCAVSVQWAPSPLIPMCTARGAHIRDTPVTLVTLVQGDQHYLYIVGEQNLCFLLLKVLMTSIPIATAALGHET